MKYISRELRRFWLKPLSVAYGGRLKENTVDAFFFPHLFCYVFIHACMLYEQIKTMCMHKKTIYLFNSLEMINTKSRIYTYILKRNGLSNFETPK